MGLVALSILLALVGVVASRLGLARLTAGAPARDPHVYWGVGLAALAPAWLIAFVALLPSEAGVRPQLVSSASWLLSGAAALIGAIVTEARARESGPPRRPATHSRPPDPASQRRAATHPWRLGALALVPGWLIALAGHVVR
jgi:hypothetical protein